jgi:hypothetical protein
MAITASMAFPPFRRTAIPAAEARGWSDATAPMMPRTSGRLAGGKKTGSEPGPSAAGGEQAALRSSPNASATVEDGRVRDGRGCLMA